jgi:hypothetical protein
MTKVGGNKIRRTMTPPIFSNGMLDILLVEWCSQGRKLFGSSTRSTGASSNPDALGEARTMEKTHHWSHGTRWWTNGDDLESLGMHNMTLQRTTRSSSSTSSDQLTRRHCSHQHSARPPKQVAEYFGYSRAPRSLHYNESRTKSIGVFYKWVRSKHWRSCTLKFSGQHAALKLKWPLLTRMNSV